MDSNKLLNGKECKEKIQGFQENISPMKTEAKTVKPKAS